MTERRTIKFVPEKLHFLSVFTPWTYEDEHESRTRYSLRLPADQFPEVGSRNRDDGLGDTINASTKFQPTFMPGQGEDWEWDLWDRLVRKAERWKYPIDRLLIGREIQVTVDLWQPTNEHWNRFRIGTGTYAALVAVNALGDLLKDEGLEKFIAETKAEFGETES